VVKSYSLLLFFSDVGTPNDFLRVSVSSEDDRGIKLVRQYHTGPRNSPWPSGSIATDPLTLTTTALTTSSANVRDPVGSAVFIVNATDEAGNWAEASFTIPINKRSSGVLTAIDKRNVQSKSTLYTGSPDSLTSGSLKLVVVADFDVAVSGVTKDNLLCIAGNTPCWTGASPVTLTAAPGGKRFTFNFDVAAAFVTQGKLITISVLMTRSDGTKVISTRDSYEIAAPAPVFVSIDKTAVVPVTYVAPYRALSTPSTHLSCHQNSFTTMFLLQRRSSSCLLLPLVNLDLHSRQTYKEMQPSLVFLLLNQQLHTTTVLRLLFDDKMRQEMSTRKL